jgi:hypothetical protein
VFSGFNVPDLFPTWTTVLAKLTGMTRSLKEIHKTVDTILEEIIEERKCFGFQLTNSIIKAIILVNNYTNFNGCHVSSIYGQMAAQHRLRLMHVMPVC